MKHTNQDDSLTGPFTIREYAFDMEMHESTAWNKIIRGVRKGLFVKADKVKRNGRYYQRYAFPGEEKKEFVMPKSSFWNDPFNKARRRK